MDRRAILTHQARIGIVEACRAWRVGVGDEILAPAYNCGSEIDPLFRSGASVAFYRVDRRAEIDVEDIQRRATSRTRVVYVTHYFGWPQELRPLAAWCQQRGILLFEDSALSLFSSGPEGPVGSVGDAAFFSFPKTLPTPDGGVWICRNSVDLPQPGFRQPSLRRVVRKCLPLIKRRLINMTSGVGVGSWLARISLHKEPRHEPVDLAIRPDMPANYYFDDQTSDWDASRITRGLLRSFLPDQIVRRRRRNYQRLMTALAGISVIEPLFPDLPEGVCPLGLPVLVQDRKWWFRMLTARQIGVYRWWEGYHRDFSWQGFEEACYLKDHVLVLPVHQDLSDAQIDFISETVKDLVRTAPAPQTDVQRPGPAVVTSR